jgi:hypothetical protein
MGHETEQEKVASEAGDTKAGRARSASDLRALGGMTDAVVDELRRTAATHPEAAVQAALALLEELPVAAAEVYDPRGQIYALVERLSVALVNAVLEQEGSSQATLERLPTLERLFTAWSDDETGVLSPLAEAIIGLVTTKELEDTMLRMVRARLRLVPHVLVPKGERLGAASTVTVNERFRIESLAGALLDRRSKNEYSLLAAKTLHRLTGDALPFVERLVGAGLPNEAIEVARRALNVTNTPQRDAVQAAYDRLVARHAGDKELLERRIEAFLREPGEDAFLTLKRMASGDKWERMRLRVIGRLEKSGVDNELAFKLYIDEGLLSEADGMVTHRFLDPFLLARASDGFADTNPGLSAGWALVACYNLMRLANDEASYRQTAEWLVAVRTRAGSCGQTESFERAIEDFKSRFSRRTRLIRTLQGRGL